jgi:hypothetical protein
VHAVAVERENPGSDDSGHLRRVTGCERLKFPWVTNGAQIVVRSSHSVSSCNGALGQFRDRADLMLRAVAYLGRDLLTPVSEMPEFSFGVCIGGDLEPRPTDEPDAA